METVIESNAEVRSTTRHELNGVCVRCVLGQYYRSTFQGVGTSSSTRDATRKDGQRLFRSERDLVKNDGLVVVLHKDATRDDSKEGIEVVGVRTLEPIHVQPSGATDWCRQNFET